MHGEKVNSLSGQTDSACGWYCDVIGVVRSHSCCFHACCMLEDHM